MTLSIQKINYHTAEGIEHKQALSSLLARELTCLVIENFVAEDAASATIEGLEQQQKFVEHADVPGLKVLGLSHFQAVRNPEIFEKYSHLGSKLETLLQSTCGPSPSPFHCLKSYLRQNLDVPIKNLKLQNELSLAPFTIRSCGQDIGIEPHQDVLSAESPLDEFALNVSMQLAINIFLSSTAEGGELEIFDLNPKDTGYINLDEGPKTFSEEKLPRESIRVSPKTGDLIIFDCTKLHIVRPNKSSSARVTLACFVAKVNNKETLRYWV